MNIVPELELLKIETTNLTSTEGSFVIEPLLPGYGVTIGNALRRVLLSSIPGAAITTIRVNDATHEFSTIDGVTEDMVEIIMNLKQIRFNLHGDEPVSLILESAGAKTVTAANFEKNSQIEIMNPDAVIAHLDKKGSLKIEAKVERGRGYLPTEKRRSEKLPLGMIAIDAIFTPIRKVNYTIENTRVGQETNFDKVLLEMSTDGTINPAQALKMAAQVLTEHFSLVSAIDSGETKPKTIKETKKSAPKKPGKIKK